MVLVLFVCGVRVWNRQVRGSDRVRCGGGREAREGRVAGWYVVGKGRSRDDCVVCPDVGHQADWFFVARGNRFDSGRDCSAAPSLETSVTLKLSYLLLCCFSDGIVAVMSPQTSTAQQVVHSILAEKTAA